MSLADREREEDEEFVGRGALTRIEPGMPDDLIHATERMLARQRQRERVNQQARTLLREHGVWACGRMIEDWLAANRGARLLAQMGWQVADMGGVAEAFNSHAREVLTEKSIPRDPEHKLAVTLRLAALVAVRAGVGPGGESGLWDKVMERVWSIAPAPLLDDAAWAVAVAEGIAHEASIENEIAEMNQEES